MTRSLPSISIVVITYNNERTIEECLRNIASQNYPKNKIEYLNIDGGSSDNTIKIVAKSPFTTVKSPVKKNAEAQRAVGLQMAKHNLVVSIDADNYIEDRNWLRAMVSPFQDNDKVVHANTLHYAYKKDATFFNRYCALFGVLDPIVYYVGRPDRVPLYKKKWEFGKVVEKNENYFIVKHTRETLPTVGCNGVVYRRDLLLKYAKSSPRDFLHIDVFVDLIEQGFNTFSVVNTQLYHDTSVDLISLLKKRILFLSYYYLKGRTERRYLIYNPKSLQDNVKLFLFIMYTLTVIKPLWDGFYGYRKIKDSAWLMHPVICFVFLFSYGFVTIKKMLKNE